jgi:superoxide dismutase, Fe-Mn family
MLRFVAPEAIDEWANALPRDKAIVAYCLYGFQVSGEATAELRRRGLQARRLAGGITAWRAMAGPTIPLTQAQS